MAIACSNGLYTALKRARNSFLSEKLLRQQGYNQHASLGNELSSAVVLLELTPERFIEMNLGVSDSLRLDVACYNVDKNHGLPSSFNVGLYNIYLVYN